MNAEEFDMLLNNNKKEFMGIVLEGSFLNKDLRNLIFDKCCITADFTGANLSKSIFKNCSLNTCVFKYCNLEQSSFKNNSLDDIDLRYVSYSNLTFINNYSNGHLFSKESLEKLCYANYPGFHIVNIEAGWFEAIIVDRTKIIEVSASFYLGNDAPLELLSGLAEICKSIYANKKSIKWLCWDGEPNAILWKIENNGEKIVISLYITECEAYEIDRTSIENYALSDPDIKIEGESIGFIKEVIETFEKIRDLMGLKKYEKEWGYFPNNELAVLKEYINKG